MTSSTPAADAATTNGPAHEEDDTFERDLKQMLKEGPTLNDLSNNVQEGNTDSSGVQRPTSFSTQSSIPRSASVPPGKPATSNIPLSSPDRNNRPTDKPTKTLQPAISKLDSIKAWSINTYKCTKQMLSEKLGKGSRTVDLELESSIEALRDTQRKYSNILRLSRALTNHFYHMVQTQRALGEAFGDMSQKSPELQEEFAYNGETQRALCKNGEALLGALNFFTSSVNTLVNKTMEDTLQTIKLYETSRIEYDAYRTDLEQLQLGPRDATTTARIDDANRKFSSHKEKFDRLRGDVAIKLKFLEENKVKVMHKQLLLFHNAVSSYFTGNQSALEATLKQFNIKLKPPNADKPSWLEQQQ